MLSKHACIRSALSTRGGRTFSYGAVRDQLFPNDYNWRTTMQYVASQIEGMEYMFSWQYRVIATRTAEILGTSPPIPEDFATFMQGRIEIPSIMVHPRIISVLIDRLSAENRRNQYMIYERIIYWLKQQQKDNSYDSFITPLRKTTDLTLKKNKKTITSVATKSKIAILA